ncbi:MAG: glycoside hydrolase family 97 protein [Pirellulales bacterium]|nr:glycoside hydrolase family 97 protein [Pirellulales bacterium]
MSSMESRIIVSILLLAGFLCTVSPLAAVEPLSVSSPDGNLTVTFSLKSDSTLFAPNNRAHYRVDYRGNAVLADSPLGLDFIGGPLDIVATQRQSHDATWENRFGAKRNVPDRYNQLTVSLHEREKPGRRMDLIFRVYNEGVAFRYYLPKQEAMEKFTLRHENTGFYFAADASAFALNMGRFNTHNEGEHLPIKLSAIKPDSIINLPLLVHVPDGPWVALLEADLTDYAGMYLGGVPGGAHALRCRLSPTPGRKADQVVVGTTPAATPWRVLMIAPTPGRLIENNYLILNLNPPCALADTSWIQPGKAAWDWWSGSFAKDVDFKPGMNTPTMKHYIDFAAASRLEYMLVDAGWCPSGKAERSEDILKYKPEVDVPEIIAYGKQKGVKVMLWVDWLPLSKQMDEAFALYEKWGASGVKVDYMNRDDQEMVGFYHRCVRTAAKHRLAVDFHGAYKPTGLRRTYPNLLTREAVMGMEYGKWSKRITPEHDVTIPFTRMLAGPMDFTPGSFLNAARGRFKVRDVEPMSQGTRAHQLAMYVVYESPLVMVSDYPEAYKNQPGLEFIEKVPTVWDDTKVLNGEPARFITVVRRKDQTWYLGAMTNWDARDLELPLDFLGPGEFEVQLFADGPDADKEAASLRITTQRVNADDKLHLHLAPGGGAAGILRFAQDDPDE